MIVDVQVDELEASSDSQGQVVERRAFISAPKAEVKDNVGTELQGAQRQPDQPTLEDLPLPTCQRLAERPGSQVSEQR